MPCLRWRNSFCSPELCLLRRHLRGLEDHRAKVDPEVLETGSREQVGAWDNKNIIERQMFERPIGKLPRGGLQALVVTWYLNNVNL